MRLIQPVRPRVRAFFALPIIAVLAVAAAGAIPQESAEAVLATTPLAAAIVPVGNSVSAPLIDAVDASAEAALAALSDEVVRLSDSNALRVAFEAYFSYRDARPDRVRNPYLYFVDLGLDNHTARGYVFDMEALALVEGPFHVSHGRGSSSARNGVPTRFSNGSGTNASSLGLYLAQETYTFRGKTAGRAYVSTGLRMSGESGRFNDAARQRGIVAHGAPYVTAKDAGRSEGCPAMEMARAERLLPLLADGGVVLIYSPRDDRWLSEDPWINAN